MISSRDTNLAICRALGIDPKTAKAIDLHLQADAPPTLRITSFMLDAAGVSEETQGFDITLRKVDQKPEPFNLDQACEDALDRLDRQLDEAAAWCLHFLASNGRERRRSARLS